MTGLLSGLLHTKKNLLKKQLMTWLIHFTHVLLNIICMLMATIFYVYVPHSSLWLKKILKSDSHNLDEMLCKKTTF